MIARIRRSARRDDRGFTLVELLVVMIIIGILASIAIPVLVNQRKKAVDVSLKSDMRTYALHIESEALQAQTYPTASRTIRSTGAALPVALSAGSNLRYQRAGKGFCIVGWNSRSNAQTNRAAYWYSSRGGGLLSGPPTGTPASCR